MQHKYYIINFLEEKQHTTMKKNRAYWNSLLHRYLAYFFLGLIVAFSASGIILNHRVDIDPQEYIVETEAIKFDLPEDKLLITDDFFKTALINKKITEDYNSFRIRDNEIRLYLKDAFVNIDANTGNGEIDYVRTIPVLGQMTILHKSTNKWWVWFSDIFGIAMLIIAITGMFISKGKFSFKKRGWILTLLGLIFPFIFLFR